MKALLIANRGEIALRIISTCRRLGIRTVAVYSSAEHDALHVSEADRAVRLSGDSYLDAEALIAAARAERCDAIHPGYGFLSEDPAFAEAVAAAGLLFVGPPAAVMQRLGRKDEARKAAVEAGVPVVPGYDGDAQDDPTLLTRAAEIGFPLLLKAAAGGGGRGMRLVEREDEFSALLATARREAESSFGDPRVLLEKAVLGARHIEVQVLGDSHGRVVHLFERDCSLQRRYQKVIEESPAAAIAESLLTAIRSAAVTLAARTGLVGAATVEFLVQADEERFYFLEVNPRLQVEHPVTELITGLDLVALQLRIADGEPLPFTQEQVRKSGAAVEARIYAENPAVGFLPRAGVLETLTLPPHRSFTDPGAGMPRIDHALAPGIVITPHFDPLLMKVIARGQDLREARENLLDALRQIVIDGVETNLSFLIELLELGDRVKLHTRTIEEYLSGPESHARSAAARRSVACGFLLFEQLHEAAVLWGVAHADPFIDRGPWRGVGASTVPLTVRLELAAEDGLEPEIYSLNVVERQIQPGGEVVLTVERGNERITILGAPTRQFDEGWSYSVNGEPSLFRSWELTRSSGERLSGRVLHQGRWYRLQPVERRQHAAEGALTAGEVTAPLPGTVRQIKAKVGQQVSAGEILVVIESMKMEHNVAAPADATVEELFCEEGDTVQAGRTLVRISAL